jgi:tetratricopeptide (TPR) repeat protein
MRRRTGAVCLIVLALGVDFGCSKNASYLAQGNRYFEARQYADASLQFKKAIQKNPNLGEAYYRLGLLQMEQNSGMDAYTSLSSAVRLMPQNVAAKVKLADVSFALYVALPDHPHGLYDKAEQLADQLLVNNKDSFEGLRLKASLRLMDRQPGQAILLFDRANRIEPMRPDLVEGWVQALFQDGRGAEGERLAWELIKKNKTFGPIYDVLYRHYASTGRAADAENLLKVKCANNPQDTASLLQLARFYGSVQRPAEMNNSLQRVLGNPKDFPDGRLQVGNFLVGIGQWDQALQVFEDGTRIDPKEKLSYLKRVTDTLIAQRKFDQASGVTEQILVEAPKDADARRIRATLWLESGTPEKVAAAQTELLALAAAKPDDTRLTFLLGRTQLAQGDSDGARSKFQQVIGLHPNDLQSRFALASISLNQQKPEEALRYAEEILSRDATNDRAALLRAAAMVAAGRHGEARVELRRLLLRNPDSGEIQLQVALLAIAEKRFSEADGILRKLHESKAADPEICAALVELYAAQGRMDRAIETLSGDLKKVPESLAVRRLLAATEARAGKYDLALAEYRRLTAADPKSIELYLHLSEVYRLKGQIDNAIAILDQARQVAPKDPEPLMSMALTMEGAGRYREAQDNYRRVLELRPGNPFVQNNIAFLLMETGGDADEALRLTQSALKKAPEDPVLTDTLGWIYFKKGRLDAATQTLAGVVRQEPRNPIFRYHLAMALLEKGDTQKAKTEAQVALGSSPAPEIANKITALLKKIG